MSMEATNLHKVNLCLEWHHGEKKQWIGMPPRALVSDFDEYKHSIHYLIVVAVLRINAAYCLTASMYMFSGLLTSGKQKCSPLILDIPLQVEIPTITITL